MSIPKIIHLCWFGRGAYSPLAKLCLESWSKFLPEYEIRLWNEDNYDVNCCSFSAKAYENKKWAFVSDYARLSLLYRYGGVYMDTDLEVIKDFSALLEGKRFVSSYIEGGLITAGFIACEAGHPFVKKLLDYYETESLKIDRGEEVRFVMNPLIYTEIAMEAYGFDPKAESFCNDEITVYPIDYFMAYKKVTYGSSYSHWRYRITDRTHTIHHDMSSWHKRNKIKKFIKDTVRFILPQNVYNSMKIKKNLSEMENRKNKNSEIL